MWPRYLTIVKIILLFFRVGDNPINFITWLRQECGSIWLSIKFLRPVSRDYNINVILVSLKLLFRLIQVQPTLQLLSVPYVVIVVFWKRKIFVVMKIFYLLRAKDYTIRFCCKVSLNFPSNFVYPQISFYFNVGCSVTPGL